MPDIEFSLKKDLQAHPFQYGYNDNYKNLVNCLIAGYKNLPKTRFLIVLENSVIIP